MNSAIFALGVGMLFATGTFLVLRRRPIKLLLGLGLLTHGVNLLIFSTAAKDSGLPPIEDKATFAGDIAPYVDPVAPGADPHGHRDQLWHHRVYRDADQPPAYDHGGIRRRRGQRRRSLCAV